MTQLSLFGATRRAPVLRQVDPDGPVVQGPVDIVLRLPHPAMAWDLARIELHQAEDGTWMWSTGYAGGGYRVGPKWGRFAPTQPEATHFAAGELLDWCDRHATRTDGMMISARQLAFIRTWAEGLL